MKPVVNTILAALVVFFKAQLLRDVGRDRGELLLSIREQEYDADDMSNRFVLLLAIVLSACAAPFEGTPPLAPVSEVSFHFVDQRPSTEKESHPASDTQSAVLYGDDALTPSVVENFKSALETRLGARLKDKTIVLLSAEVSLSSQDSSINAARLGAVTPPTAAGLAAVPMAAILIYAIERSRSPKNVYVRIQGTVSGHPFSAKMNEQYKGTVTSEQLQSTLRATAVLAAIEIADVL